MSGMVRAGLVGIALVGGLTAWSSGRAATASEPDVAADPLSRFETHIVATHYLKGQAYEVHHYFKPLREGVLQGVVFRDTSAGAALLEVEWAISEAVYEQLPEWQKVHWHPLAAAVDAGRIRLPGLSATEERETLRSVRGLYAQTLNLAGIDGELPIGVEGVSVATHMSDAELRRTSHEGGAK